MMTILLTILVFAVPHASAASPHEELMTLTAQLQKAPSDEALRDKIIALAKKVKPAPAVPEASRRAFIRGTTAFTDAKTSEDFFRAAARFEEASLIAPWWPDAYFNLAKAQQAAQNYDAAVRSLKRYIATANSKADIRQGQDMMYALEEKADAKKSEADKALSEAAAAAKAAIFTGSWQKSALSPNGPVTVPMRIDREAGGAYTMVQPRDGTLRIRDGRVEGNELRFRQDDVDESAVCGSYDVRGTVSGDGQHLTLVYTLLPFASPRSQTCRYTMYYGDHEEKWGRP
jgi:tetratricopeptide (TPR) repeat protein